MAFWKQVFPAFGYLRKLVKFEGGKILTCPVMLFQYFRKCAWENHYCAAFNALPRTFSKEHIKEVEKTLTALHDIFLNFDNSFLIMIFQRCTICIGAMRKCSSLYDKVAISDDCSCKGFLLICSVITRVVPLQLWPKLRILRKIMVATHQGKIKIIKFSPGRWIVRTFWKTSANHFNHIREFCHDNLILLAIFFETQIFLALLCMPYILSLSFQNVLLIYLMVSYVHYGPH